MTSFEAFLQVGIQHILDPNAYDHILFIIALCSIYRPSQIKEVLILATAFTIGHSATLLIAIYNWHTLPSEWIEFGILASILIVALKNLFMSKKIELSQMISYALAIVFGLIHGLGFSSFLRSILRPREKLWSNLLSFNVGIELAQVVIILFFFLIYLVTQKIFHFKHKSWVLFWNVLVILFTLDLILF